MAQKTLANFTRGMDRQRLRASPKEGTFYNLLNCYITPSGTIRKRGGFRKLGTVDTGTRGLYANNGTLRTFYTGAVLTPPAGLAVEYDAIQPDDSSLTLSKVWADYLFLRRQFVSAEFSDGNVYTFWLPSSGSDGSAPTWQANTLYNVGDAVQPSVPNGYTYVLQSGPNDDLPVWAAGQAHATGDKIQPTVRNGYYFTATNTIGDNPKSGTTEPKWPTSTGAVVYEDGTDTGATATTPTAPTSPTGGDRYGNLAGSGAGGTLPSLNTTKQL